MGTYRFYLLGDHTVRGRFDFQAEDNDRAAESGEILFDGCSDRCDSYEIWQGDVLLVNGPQQIGARASASDLAGQVQESIARYEEIILNSEWAIASSQRLLAEFDKLKVSKRGSAVRRHPDTNEPPVRAPEGS